MIQAFLVPYGGRRGLVNFVQGRFGFTVIRKVFFDHPLCARHCVAPGDVTVDKRQRCPLS